MKRLFSKVKDCWMTWRTGKSKSVRDWECWRDKTINYRAESVQEYFHNFQYIIEVNPDRFWNHSEPFAWVPVEEFRQYQYPQRCLGDNAVVQWVRGDWDRWGNYFYINDCFGGDYVFVATNNESDAIMIALKWK